MCNHVDNGIIDLPNVAKLVANYPSLTYRFMAQHIDGKVQVARLIIGAPSASWSSYTYDTALFRAGSETGTTISTWLSEGKITFHDNQCYLLPPLQSSASFQRCPSHTSHSLFSLSKP